MITFHHAGSLVQTLSYRFHEWTLTCRFHLHTLRACGFRRAQFIVRFIAQVPLCRFYCRDSIVHIPLCGSHRADSIVQVLSCGFYRVILSFKFHRANYIVRNPSHYVDSMLQVSLCGFYCADSIVRIPLCWFHRTDSIVRNPSL